jgi:hypothetical protein
MPPQPFKTIPGMVDWVSTHASSEAPLLLSADFQPVPSIIGVHSDEYVFVIPMVSLSPNFLGP